MTTAGHDVKKFFINSDFNKSQYSATFLNQLLSYAMVNRYGGYALNFDTLLIKSILGLNSNFLTKCSEDSIEDLPYFLHHKHPLMDDVLSQLSKGFNMVSNAMLNIFVPALPGIMNNYLFQERISNTSQSSS